MTAEQIVERLRLISKHPRSYDVSLTCVMAADKLELLESTIAGQETLQTLIAKTQKELDTTKRENDYLRELLSKYGCYVTPGTTAKCDTVTQYDRIKGLTLGEMAKEFEGECNRCRLHGGQVCHIGNCEQGTLQYLMSEVKQNE